MPSEPTPSEASAPMRAKRLKRLRNLANLSREEMCNEGDINVHTLIAWENSRFGGLTPNGAKKVIERVTKEGVYCSEDWLLQGTGSEPSVNPIHAPHENLPKNADEAFIIAYELSIFKMHNENAVSMRVNDNSMQPQFQTGDYVAGKKKTGKAILKTLGHDCIVETSDGKMYLRNLRAGKSRGTFTLISHDTKQPVMIDVKLAYAAPVLWHRKKDKCV